MLKKMMSLSATVCMGFFSVIDTIASLSMDNSILFPFNGDKTDKWRHLRKKNKHMKAFTN
jgi:hypothetical protein